MDRKTIYRKTAKGLAEITSPSRTVERRVRPALILTDGNRTGALVLSLTNGIGIQEMDFDQLIDSGFIEAIALPGGADGGTGAQETAEHRTSSGVSEPRSDLERYSDGQRFLNETMTDHLGVRAYFFVLKVERCSSAEDLIALVPQFEQALARKVDQDFAKRCARIAMAILKK